MVALSKITQEIGLNQPLVIERSNNNQAAVSLILMDSLQGVKILFIERAKRRQDPWSGQMAFPGGKRDLSDVNVQATAQRETLEEIGVDLSLHRYVGQIDDLAAPPSSPAYGLVVSCYVFVLVGDVKIKSNVEVQDTIWMPISELTAEANFLPNYKPKNYEGEFPGICVSSGDLRVIWGLTYRFLCSFFRVCELSHY